MSLADIMSSGAIPVIVKVEIPVTVKVESAEQKIERVDRDEIIEAFKFGDSTYGPGKYDLFFENGIFLYHCPKGS